MTGFMFIPEHVMENEDLSIQEKMIFGRIIGLTKKEGYCYANNEWLGKQLGLSGDRVSHYINTLVKKGMIRTEITRKTKKQLIEEGIGETGLDAQKYATTRKIFVYLAETRLPGVGGNADKGGVENAEYSSILKRGEGETPPLSLECLYKDFKQSDQLALLRSVMGIFDSIDYEAVLLRVRNSKSRGSFLETIYHWWFQDIHDGKIGSNLYIYNADAVYVDAMPTTFVEAQNLMNQKLIENEKIKPGFISSFVTTTPKYDL